MLSLLRDIAVDPDEPVDDTNPLSQVIINTHSPAVVLEAPDDALLMVESHAEIVGHKTIRRMRMAPLPDTWRSRAAPNEPPTAKGHLLAYLNPVPKNEAYMESIYAKVGREALAKKRGKATRVVDRADLQLLLPRVAE
jgi:hypothetical protein